jgi:hypothetical protein
MAEFPEADIHIEKRHKLWHVVWRRPGYPPRMLMAHLALNEAQRAEDRGERRIAAKLRKAAAEARNKNEREVD